MSTPSKPDDDASDRSVTRDRPRATVLVVDDEALVRGLASTVLGLEGYRVIVADQGAAALAAIEACGGDAAPAEAGRSGEPDEPEGPVDLVILDMQMPGMSGEETLRRIRGLLPDVPVLLSSGDDVERDLRALGVAGPIGSLPKPYTIDGLVARVAAELGR